jgi:hypothetical protein
MFYFTGAETSTSVPSILPLSKEALSHGKPASAENLETPAVLCFPASNNLQRPKRSQKNGIGMDL